MLGGYSGLWGKNKDMWEIQINIDGPTTVSIFDCIRWSRSEAKDDEAYLML